MKSNSLQYLACLCLLFTCVVANKKSNNHNKNKEKKKNLEWKQPSLALSNKRTWAAYEGDKVVLNCSASGNQLSVSWLKNGAAIVGSPNVQIEKFFLTLKDVTTDSAGNYTCVVSSKTKQISWSVDLAVTVKAWPLIIEGPHNITQPVGSDVSFQCKVTNDPKATIKWQKGKQSEDGEHTDVAGDRMNPSVLTLTNIQKSHEGMYRCVAVNVYGLKNVNAWLTVIEPTTSTTTLPPRTEQDNYGMNSNNAYSYTEKDKTRDIFESGQIFETTRRANRNKKIENEKEPKRKGKKNENKKKPNKNNDKKEKGKDMKPLDDDDEEDEQDRYYQTTLATTSSSTTEGTQTIWTYQTNDYDMNSRFNAPNNPPEDNDDGDDHGRGGKTSSAKAGGASSHPGSISSWTIYTIVGAVGGVVLLIGLIAITLTVCCQKDEGGIYKSTPV